MHVVSKSCVNGA